MVEESFSRTTWVDRELPCGLTMTDGLWRYLCSAGTGELHKEGRDLFTKSGRKTVLNNYEPEVLLRMAMEATMPESMKPQ